MELVGFLWYQGTLLTGCFCPCIFAISHAMVLSLPLPNLPNWLRAGTLDLICHALIRQALTLFVSRVILAEAKSSGEEDIRCMGYLSLHSFLVLLPNFLPSLSNLSILVLCSSFVPSHPVRPHISLSHLSRYFVVSRLLP
jgi:hypothetical protein